MLRCQMHLGGLVMKVKGRNIFVAALIVILLPVYSGSSAAGRSVEVDARSDRGAALQLDHTVEPLPRYTLKQLKRACQSTAIRAGARCAGQGRINDICRNSWGGGARFGDIGFDRRGLLYCEQVPYGFIGMWKRY